ncbi:hypothetical protein A3K92_00180 [Thermococcus gorgonarius]|uniref:Uncharacterized protein n=2 Tax=Thermococcus gorgonarius TaxID=71997 RepID=A0A2Z2M4S0_THEGO|nr:hypothetical protein A3K92_00180 [Thermococcus gorgonarius]
MKRTLAGLGILFLLLPYASAHLVVKSSGYMLFLRDLDGHHYFGYTAPFWMGLRRPSWAIFLNVGPDRELKWAYNYSTMGGMAFYTGIKTENGFLLLGEAGPSGYAVPLAVMLDDSGNVVWSRAYNLGEEAQGMFLDAVPSGEGVLAAGLTLGPGGDIGVILMNLSYSGDVTSAVRIPLGDVLGPYQITRSNGGLFLSWILNATDFVTAELDSSGSVLKAVKYSLPSSLVGETDPLNPMRNFFYVPSFGGDGPVLIGGLGNGSVPWLLIDHLESGECLNVTLPLEGVLSSVHYSPGEGFFGVFASNISYSELPGPDHRIRTLLINASLLFLLQGNGGVKVFIKPLGNVTSAYFSFEGISIGILNNVSNVTVFDGKFDPVELGFSELEVVVKKCSLSVKSREISLDSKTVNVTYMAVPVNRTPISLEVSVIGEEKLEQSPPWIFALLFLLSTLTLVLWARR